MAQAEREIESNGLSFETLLGGPEDGEAVVLLHGYPQSAAVWRPTMDWLGTRGYRSIAPNLRGYSPGANPSDAAAYTMDKLVGDVLGIADAEGVDRFHLVGHDWGGALAWAIAATHPERLLSLTVVSTPHGGAMAATMRNSTQALRSAYMRFFRIPRVPEAVLNAANLAPTGLGLRVFGLPRASWHRDRDQLRRSGGLHGPLNWYRGALGSPGRPRLITVPTLYIWGRRDPFFGRRAAELTATKVTGPYRFEELKAGHWIVDRNGVDLQRLLGEHLHRNRAPAASPAGTPEPTKAATAAPKQKRAAAPRKPATTPKRAPRPKRKPEEPAG